MRPTLVDSQTDFECSPYCSTSGRIFVVTMRCALLKLESISMTEGQQLASLSDWWCLVIGPCSVKVMDCSSFSSSSVRVSGLVLDVPGTDMISEFKQLVSPVVVWFWW